ncbi:hypothetical protein Psed_4954 [Pseudonocardia dioxanivorans CB1190]|uniref:Uncharacterized protein n=1 Tax=Pseudonocardia dioxanivorans (strain ATCC 55486 / DSM 44775 / JCM 13855 / CB1190) TaxID=675635 RepID=F4CLP1_PSEUX|nr:hypothetical protein [Pseudonocardia dioxanivorans]AEA27094.1 hypothetical protein Psed_4954 [Pseudonocardia dioxanivorans CB1190]
MAELLRVVIAVNAIFAKLGLVEEPVHRRVAAVPAYLQDRTAPTS